MKQRQKLRLEHIEKWLIDNLMGNYLPTKGFYPLQWVISWALKYTKENNMTYNFEGARILAQEERTIARKLAENPVNTKGENLQNKYVLLYNDSGGVMTRKLTAFQSAYLLTQEEMSYAREFAEDQDEKNSSLKWVSVEDRVPTDEVQKLVIRFDDINEYSHPYTHEDAQSIAFYSNGKWWDEAFPEKVKEENIIEGVTHWRDLPVGPLPEVPKQ